MKIIQFLALKKSSPGWMGGCESCFTDCLQHKKIRTTRSNYSSKKPEKEWQWQELLKKVSPVTWGKRNWHIQPASVTPSKCGMQLHVKSRKANHYIRQRERLKSLPKPCQSSRVKQKTIFNVQRSGRWHLVSVYRYQRLHHRRRRCCSHHHLAKMRRCNVAKSCILKECPRGITDQCSTVFTLYSKTIVISHVT